MALALALVSFAAGRLTTLAQMSRSASASAPTVSPTPPIAELPPEEVSGEDVPDLPRYPGSTRVEFRRTVHADVTVTESEYVVDDEIDEIRDFFRNFLYANGWTITDFDFSAGEWTIVAIAGEREVVLEIESRGSLAEYEVKLTEPNAAEVQQANTTATAEAVVPAEETTIPVPPALAPTATFVPVAPPPTAEPAPPAPARPQATAAPPANRPRPPAPAPPPPADDGADDQDDGREGDDGPDDGDDGADGDDG